MSCATLLLVLLCAGCSHGTGSGLSGSAYRETLSPTWNSYRFRDVVEQKRDYSCGSTAILTLLQNRFEADDLPSREEMVAQMLERTDLERKEIVQGKGFSFLDLKRQLEAMGYASAGVELPLKTLLDLRVPAILHLSVPPTEHFVTWRGAANGRVMLGDPSRGAVNYPVAELIDEWTGYALLVAEAGKEPPKIDADEIIERARAHAGARASIEAMQAETLRSSLDVR